MSESRIIEGVVVGESAQSLGESIRVFFGEIMAQRPAHRWSTEMAVRNVTGGGCKSDWKPECDNQGSVPLWDGYNGG